MTALSHAQKTLFPSDVLKVKEELRTKGDKLFDILRKLTESEDLPQLNDLKEMWLLLEAAEKAKYGSNSSDAWVRYFAIYAASYSDLPHYYYQKAIEREELIKDLQKHSEALITILLDNALDYRLAYSEERKLLSFYPDLDFAERREADKHETSKPRISELLSKLVKRAVRQISSVEAGRYDERLRARLFVCNMAEFLANAYEGKIKDVGIRNILITATAALHDVSYDDDGIRKILERGKSDKDGDDFSSLSHE